VLHQCRRCFIDTKPQDDRVINNRSKASITSESLSIQRNTTAATASGDGSNSTNVVFDFVPLNCKTTE
jgi:hypothetical protein